MAVNPAHISWAGRLLSAWPLSSHMAGRGLGHDMLTVVKPGKSDAPHFEEK